MAHEQRLKNSLDMLYLAACALHDAVPDARRMADMDLAGVMTEAARQSMNGIAYLGIQKYVDATPNAGDVTDADRLAQWKQSYAQIIRKAVLFDMERERILSFLDQNGIWYLPLKGIILQNMYPRIGMRQMADNDILFDANYRAELKSFMLENGYKGGEKVGRTDAACHDTYLKAPFYNFEMHYSLHPASEKEIELRHYYADIKERLIKDNGNSCGYHMSDEDFYIYVTTHAYKHYSRAGTGVRLLMDTYVYLSQKKDQMDLAYVEKELAALGLADFEKTARTAAFKVFSEPNHKGLTKFTETETELLTRCIHAGVYGTSGIAMKTKLSELSEDGRITPRIKLKYFMGRLIPGDDCYMLRYPLAYRHRILIPFVVVARILEAVFTKPGALVKEIKALSREK